MGLFDKLKRVFGGSPEEAARRADDGIERFWAFWTEHTTRIEAQVGEQMDEDLVEAVSKAVRAVHPDLDWEFGPGDESTHSFTLTGHGDPNLRQLAERWRAAAPETPGFDLFTTRQAVPRDQVMGITLAISDVKLDFEQLRFQTKTDDSRRCVDVVIHHPAFAKITGDEPMRASFILLDQILGEDGVERWIGDIAASPEPVEGGVDALALLDAVAEVSALPEDRWCLGEGESEGLPLVYVVNLAIKRWDYPRFDTFCVVRIEYEAEEGGMPSEADKAELDLLEEGLVGLVGAAAVNLGRRTGNALREIYLYVDGSGDTPERILSWTRGCGWPARLQVEEDPTWRLRP